MSGLNENNGSSVISTLKLKQTGVAAVIGRTGHTVSTLLIQSLLYQSVVFQKKMHIHSADDQRTFISHLRLGKVPSWFFWFTMTQADSTRPLKQDESPGQEAIRGDVLGLNALQIFLVVIILKFSHFQIIITSPVCTCLFAQVYSITTRLSDQE